MMEPRPSHLTVGALVLLLACSLPVLALWSSRSTGLGLVDHYIRFHGSVVGLEVGSSVLFGGIPVGHVTAIRVDPQNSSLARVDLLVDGSTPIYSDSKATMQMQSIAGNVLIDISRGGGAGSRRLGPGEEVPARYSALGKLLLSLEELPAKGDLLIQGASALLSAQNVALADRILANIDKLRDQIAAETPVFNSLSPGISDAMARFRQAWAEFQQGGENIDRLKASLAAANQSIQTMSATLSTTATSLGGFVDDNRRPIQDFASNGYPQIAPMISDLHRLGRTLNRLWTEMKQDPARFFLTDRQEGGFTAPPPNIGPHR
jgi:phospholipid/cholesterol/gamma-HCH transport system substrate-binding protein